MSSVYMCVSLLHATCYVSCDCVSCNILECC